jgi:hypothetical protein
MTTLFGSATPCRPRGKVRRFSNNASLLHLSRTNQIADDAIAALRGDTSARTLR